MIPVRNTQNDGQRGAAALVEVRDLKVTISGRQVASLPDLNLGPGECVALVGESGSGKTTSLLALLGLLRASDCAVSGSVRVCDVDVLAASPNQLRSLRGARIALVMQSPQGSLNPTMRLGVLLRHALTLHGIKGRPALSRIKLALDSVRLQESILRRYPHEISGGQAQRFGIALALALGADIIAADEPTSALDVTVQAEIMALLQQLRQQQGMALLLVSHDLALVSTVADRVIVMRDGQVVESGPAQQVLQNPAEPYTRELLAAVPTLEGAK
ncbi:ATP-binding cassette domain-containing protein [Arthrobacter sp. FW306-04-A]|uniref:ATP-binding cassette domain-containing protein n=1 Tax=Arthrobacter sp. FW306-04-A TaxID=2879619 RepID=UPI0037BFB5AF|nr:ABC transporter ATP-binding protein [Arthrobacter sp. FW306-04-A]